jgi:hypothetical protein
LKAQAEEPNNMTKTNAKPKTWAQRFGAKRDAIDRAILAELEQTIAAEERAADATRKAIARAFGRPV